MATNGVYSNCSYVRRHNFTAKSMQIYRDLRYSCTDIRFDHHPAGRARWYSIIIPTMIILASVAVLANLTVLISCRWLRRPISKNLLLCLSLTLADTWTSALFCAALVINSYLPVVHELTYKRTYLMCGALGLEVLRQGGMITSAAHLSALSLNHYLGIVYPLKMKRYMTTSKLFVGIALLWTLPPLIILILSGLLPGQGFRSSYCGKVDFFNDLPQACTRASIFLASAGVTCFLYWRIVVNMSVRRQNPILQANIASQKHVQQNTKFAITMMLFVSTFIIGWMPYNVAEIFLCRPNVFCPFNRFPEQTIMFIRFLENSLIIAKLFINALIYSSRMVEIRYGMWRLCQCIGIGRIVSKDAQVPENLQRQTIGVTSQRRTHTANRELAAARKKNLTVVARSGELKTVKTTTEAIEDTARPFAESLVML